MAFISYGCGSPPEGHPPHWVSRPPPGVLGGHYCQGHAIDPPDMSRWLDLTIDGVADKEA